MLGCAGMADLVRELERSVGAPVLDGVCLRCQPRRKPGPHRAQDLEAQHLRAAARQGLCRPVRDILAALNRSVPRQCKGSFERFKGAARPEVRRWNPETKSAGSQRASEQQQVAASGVAAVSTTARRRRGGLSVGEKGRTRSEARKLWFISSNSGARRSI